MLGVRRKTDSDMLLRKNDSDFSIPSRATRTRRRTQNKSKSVGDHDALFNPFPDLGNRRRTKSTQPLEQLEDARRQATGGTVLLSEWDDDLQNAFD